VLIVAPSAPETAVSAQALLDAGFPVVTRHAVAGSTEQACGEDFDLILLDHDMAGLDAAGWLSRLQEGGRPASVILVGESPAPEALIRALRGGAFDFLIKPVTPARLLESVEQAVENRRSFLRIMSLSEHLKEANRSLSEQKINLEQERDLLVKRNHDLGLLNQIGQNLVGSLDAEELVQGAISRTGELVPYDQLALAWLHGNKVWGHASRGGGDGHLQAYKQATLDRARMHAGHLSGMWPLLFLGEDRREVEMVLLVGGQRMGLVRLARSPESPGFDAYEVEVLSALANSVALALRGADAHQEVQSLASTDGLTDLLNRRAFASALDREFKKTLRYGQPLGLMMIDIDHFKLINDRFGHPAGDSVLRQLAVFVGQTIRDVDVAARYGGEEFAVIMPGTGPGQGVLAAERIRQVVMDHTFIPECREHRVTVSIGVAQFQGKSGINTEDLIREADIALYRAKTNGRNRVEVGGAMGVSLRPAGSSLQPIAP
jgi:diguanylate cyclase (GGDEF)-like protein